MAIRHNDFDGETDALLRPFDQMLAAFVEGHARADLPLLAAMGLGT